MTTATANDAPTPTRLPATVIGVAAIAAALSLFGMATENHYGQCVAAAAASAPTVPSEEAGAAQREAVVGGCKRYLFV